MKKVIFFILSIILVLSCTGCNSESDEYINAEIGDYITFGTYEQDGDSSNGKEPIEWLVIDKNDDELFVVSKYGLDCKKYNEEWIYTTWEKCTLRSWLNNEFMNTAFTDDEKTIILLSEVRADKNPYFENNPGNSTFDKLFCLSIDEAEKYLTDIECKSTKYAIKNGASEEHYWWWLRTVGSEEDEASIANFISSGGSLPVVCEYASVRPALRIALSDEALKDSEVKGEKIGVENQIKSSAENTINDFMSLLQSGDYEKAEEIASLDTINTFIDNMNMESAYPEFDGSANCEGKLGYNALFGDTESFMNSAFPNVVYSIQSVDVVDESTAVVEMEISAIDMFYVMREQALGMAEFVETWFYESNGTGDLEFNAMLYMNGVVEEYMSSADAVVTTNHVSVTVNYNEGKCTFNPDEEFANAITGDFNYGSSQVKSVLDSVQ